LVAVRVTESIEINRDLAQVWDFISDPMNDPVWCPKVTLVNQVAPGRWVVQHKPIPLRPPAALTVDQIAIAAPHRLVLHEEDGASIFEVEYQLEPTSAGMRFTQVSDFTWKRLPVIVQRLLAPGVRRDVRRQLRELKRTLEAS
jgi:carbon monoxide dehydrogenase subunit G